VNVHLRRRNFNHEHEHGTFPSGRDCSAAGSTADILPWLQLRLVDTDVRCVRLWEIAI